MPRLSQARHHRLGRRIRQHDIDRYNRRFVVLQALQCFSECAPDVAHSAGSTERRFIEGEYYRIRCYRLWRLRRNIQSYALPSMPSASELQPAIIARTNEAARIEM